MNLEDRALYCDGHSLTLLTMGTGMCLEKPVRCLPSKHHSVHLGLLIGVSHSTLPCGGIKRGDEARKDTPPF